MKQGNDLKLTFFIFSRQKLVRKLDKRLWDLLHMLIERIGVREMKHPQSLTCIPIWATLRIPLGNRESFKSLNKSVPELIYFQFFIFLMLGVQ